MLTNLDARNLTLEKVQQLLKFDESFNNLLASLLSLEYVAKFEQ